MNDCAALKKGITTLTRLCDTAGYREMIPDLLNDPILILS